MREWAISGRVKIDRADEHINHLDAEVRAFKARRPYRVVHEVDPQTQWHHFVVREIEPIPILWSAIAADAVHNLHVALDHLWQRAVHGPRSVARDYFPAFENPESAKARFRGKEHGPLKRAVDLLKSVDAFEVDNPFWALRCMDDADKHDTLALVACRLDSYTMDLTRMFPDQEPVMFGHYISEDDLAIIEHGTLLYSLPPTKSKMDVDHELAFEIAFGESEVLPGEPVVPTLKYLSAAVEGLAGAFVAAGLVP